MTNRAVTDAIAFHANTAAERGLCRAGGTDGEATADASAVADLQATSRR